MGLEQQPIAFWTFVKSEVIGLICKGSLIGNLPLWFLLSLFGVKCIFSFSSSRTGHFALLVGSLAVSMLMHIINPPIDWLMNIPMGLFFYASGYFLSEKQYAKSVFVVSAISLIVIASFFDSEVSIVKLLTIFGNFYIWILYALVAVIVANNLFWRLGHNIEIKGLNWLGENSMLLYVSHWPFFKLIHSICMISGLNNPYIMLVIMIAGLAFVIYVEYKIIDRFKLGYLIGN